jgi:RNA polymerase sigma-70 factor (ECF subfamily)
MFTADVRFTMPPVPAWVDGRADELRFFAERVFALSWRFTPLHCNGQLGFGAFMKEPGGAVYQRAGINLLRLRSGQILEIASFLDPQLCSAFGLPAELI